MEFKVRLFLGDELIDPSDYDKVIINCPDVDRIVNEIYERNQRRPLSQKDLDMYDDEPDEPVSTPEKASVLEALKKNKTIVKEQPRLPRKKEKTRDGAR